MLSFWHAERVLKLRLPPLNTPIRSGDCIRQRAASPSRASRCRKQSQTANTVRPRSRHVRLRDTCTRSEIAPEWCEHLLDIPIAPTLSLQTIPDHSQASREPIGSLDNSGPKNPWRNAKRHGVQEPLQRPEEWIHALQGPPQQP